MFYSLSRTAIFLLAGSVVAWGLAWIMPDHTDQELLANYVKALDFWNATVSLGNWAWWTPEFLGGTSLAPSWGFMVTNLWVLGWSALFGATFGSKLALTACLPIAAWTTYQFALTWTGQRNIAVATACFYLAAPSLWMRIVAVEHLVVVCAMAFFPLVLLAAVQLARNPSARTALQMGASFSFLALTYTKLAFICLPVIFLLWLAETWSHNTWKRQWRSEVRISFLISLFFLGMLPLLPSLREMDNLIFFNLAPFDGWQSAFSSKSGLHLLDRFGWVSEDYAPAFAPTTASGGYYLGSCLLLTFLLAYGMRCRWMQNLPSSQTQRVLKTATVLALLSFWISFGPYTVISGHFFTLRSSIHGMEWTVLPIWGSLLLLLWLLWMLIPGHGGWRLGGYTLILLIFLLVPGFRMIEWIPFFSNIRAPFDFFQVPAPILLAVVGGILSVLVWHTLPSKILRSSLLTLAGVFVLWDVADSLRIQQQHALAPETWADFEAAEDFMKKSDVAGSVIPISGRYFYLETPAMSGRPLVTEAFQMYLQQRSFAVLLAMGQFREEFSEDARRLTGGNLIFVDEGEASYDREHPPAAVKESTQIFSNPTFSIFAGKAPLSPGFIGQDVVQMNAPEIADYPAILRAFRFSTIPLEMPIKNRMNETFSGVLEKGELKMEPRIEREGGAAFIGLGKNGVRKVNYQHFQVTAPARATGWAVLTQSWHPDWRAEVAGKEHPVYRAFGALPAFSIQQGETVDFLFRPPWWYNLCAWTTLLAWLGYFIHLCLFYLLKKNSSTQADRMESLRYE